MKSLGNQDHSIDILLVDDEPGFLEQEEIYLKREKELFNPESVTSPEKALELLGEEEFDCVVSDYQMPDMDGLEFLKVIREERGSDIPFIVFTGKSREEIAIEALNLGADRYLQKSGDPLSQFGVLTKAVEKEVVHKKTEMENERNRIYFEQLFRNSPEAIAMIDNENQFIKINDSFKDLFGITEDIEGHNVDEIIVPEEKREEGSDLAKSLMNGESIAKETVRMNKSGEKVNVIVLGYPITINDEQIGAYAIYRDITKRKKAEKELKRDKNWFEAIFENNPEAIVALNKDQKIIQVNKRFEDLFNYEKEQIKGKNINNLIVPENKIDEARDLDGKAKKEGYFNYESIRKTKEGEEIPVSITGHPIRHTDETRYLGVYKDISKRIESEKNFQKIFQNLGDAIFIYKTSPDKYGEILEANQEAVNQTGYSREELIGMNLVEDLVAEDKKYLTDEYQDQGKVTFQQKKKRKDGSEYWTEVVGVPIQYQGKEAGLSIQRDITERKITEKQLEEKQERLDLALEGANAGLWDWNVQTGKTIFDERWAEIIGYNLEELQPVNIETWKELAHPEDLKRSEKLLEKHFNGETDLYEFEGRMKHKNGDWIWVLDKGKVVEWDENGDPLRMTGVHIDITERKEAEERERFLHTLLRHDVRNKAQIVQGYHELLNEFQLPDEVKDIISKAERELDNGMDIIEKVRNLREAEKEERNPVNIDSMIQKALEQTKDMSKRNDVEIEVEYAGEVEVWGGSLLSQIFINILENAIQHSKPNKIKIRTEETKKEIITTIENDGRKVLVDDKEKIFNKGYTTDSERGTGLGLFLAKTLLDIYDGEIEVKDSDLGGARFDISLKKEF